MNKDAIIAVSLLANMVLFVYFRLGSPMHAEELTTAHVRPAITTEDSVELRKLLSELKSQLAACGLKSKLDKRENGINAVRLEEALQVAQGAPTGNAKVTEGGQGAKEVKADSPVDVTEEAAPAEALHKEPNAVECTQPQQVPLPTSVKSVENPIVGPGVKSIFGPGDLAQLSRTHYFDGDCDPVNDAQQCHMDLLEAGEDIQAGQNNVTIRIRCTAMCLGVNVGQPGHQFYVLALGPTLKEVEMTDLNHGVYLGSFAPSHPGFYNLTAVVRYYGYHAWRQPCKSEVPLFGYRAKDPIANEIQIEVKGSPPPPHAQLPLCSFHTQGPSFGEWIFKERAQHGQTHVSWVDNWEWQGEGCQYKTYTREEAHQGLHGNGIEKIHIVGDSHARVLFWTMQDFLFGGNLSNAGKKFQHDSGECMELNGNKMCLEFHWQEYIPKVEETVNEILKSEKSVLEKSALIVNAGQWDEAYKCLNGGEDSVDVITGYEGVAKALSSHSEVAAFFYTTVEHSINAKLRLPCSNCHLTPARSTVLNIASVNAMRKHDVPVLDFNAMTRPRVVQICDMAHYACATDNPQNWLRGDKQDVRSQINEEGESDKYTQTFMYGLKDGIDEISKGSVHMAGPVIFSAAQTAIQWICNLSRKKAK